MKQNATGDFRYLLNHFARREWLEKKKVNPAGWLCAQKRPQSALSKVGQFYRKLLKAKEALPDYLVVVDDDTYLNVEWFLQNFLKNSNTSSSNDDSSKERRKQKSRPTGVNNAVPQVWAGCYVRKPVMDANITFPYGGFGTYYNRKSIERLIQPIR